MPDAHRTPHAGLIHLLNQRYREEWRRAEALQDELNNLRGSGFWKAVAWMRWVKQWAWPPPAPIEPPLAAAAVPYIDPPNVPPPCGRVSIVVPFRDQVELLRNCLHSLKRTRYRDYEVILVDNGSTEARTLSFIKRLRGRKRYHIVTDCGDFNFSRLCNAGASQSVGDYLLFLNNDTEVLAPGWLEELVRLGMNPTVGAVGGTLLYPDRTLQHAGLFPRADGRWVHPYRGEPEDTPGLRGELCIVREVPAVTAACLLMRRSHFEEIGGFDERYPIELNDVDLCERLRGRGLKVLLSPEAKLIHYEGLSRGVS